MGQQKSSRSEITRLGINASKPRLTLASTARSVRKAVATPETLPEPEQNSSVGAKAPQRKDNSIRSKQKDTVGRGLIWTTVVASLVCVGLAWLIVGALRSGPTDDSSLQKREATTAESAETSPPNAPAVFETEQKTTGPVSVVQNAEAATEPAFYTGAISAPPLTLQDLQALPRAMSPAALVTSPKQLPGVRSWTVETIPYRGHVTCMDLSRDGSSVAVASEDGNIRIVDSQSTKLIKIISTENGIPEFVRWGESTESMFLSVRFSELRSLVRIDVRLGRPTCKVDLDDSVFSVSEDGESLYAAVNGRLHVLSSETLSTVEDLEIPLDHGAVRLSPDDVYIMTNSAHSFAVFKNSRPLQLVMEHERDVALGQSSWSEGGQLATGWHDGTVIVYDPGKIDTKPVATIPVYQG